MATTVSYNLAIQTEAARRALEKLYAQGNSLFAGKGINIAVNNKGLTGFNRSLDQATSRILSFTATTVLISKTVDALKRLTTEAIQVQTAITGIQAILNATNSDLGKFQKSLFDIANKTGVSFFDAAAAAQEFSRAGLSLEKTLQATAAALGVVRTSGGNVQEVIQGLISTTSAFESQNFSFQEIADKFSALDAAFSTSASGIIQALSRVGSLASEAGVSLDQLGGLIAAVKQISGRSEGQIGNSLKSIFVNLQNSTVQDAIENVGVATKDANGEFRSAIDVLTDLSESYKTLTDSQKAFLSQKVAGKFQANAFQSTIQAIQSGTAQRGERISSGADNNIAKRLELLNETTATTIQRFQNSITELSSTLGDAVGRNFVDGLLKYGNTALDGIKAIFEKGNPLGDAITSGLAAALTGPGIVVGATLLVKLFKTVFFDAVNAGRQLLKNGSILGGINTSLERQLALQQQINAVINARNGVQAAAAGVAGAAPGALGTGIRPVGPIIAKPQKANIPSSGFQSNPQVLAQQRAAAAASLRQQRADYRAQQALIRQNAAQAARNESVRLANIQSEADKQRRSQNFSRGVGAGAFLVPAATSAISSQVDDKSTKRQIDAVGQGLSTALIGSLFGPIGIAAGTVIGGFQILSTVTKELYGNLDDMNDTVREQINQNDKERQSGDLFVQAQSAYNEAVKSGSNAIIEKADRDLQIAQQNLGSSRSGLAALAGNMEKLIQENDRLNATTDSKNAGQGSRSVAEKIVTEAYAGFFNSINGIFEKQIASSADAKTLGQSITGGLDVRKVSQDTVNNLLEDFSRTGDSSKLQDFTQSFIKDLDGATEAATKFSSNFENGSERLSVAILQEIQARQRSVKITDIEAQRRTDQRGFDKLFTGEISKAFTSQAFESKLRESQRNSSLSNFAKRNEGLTGVAAIKADTAGQFLVAQNEFIKAIEDGKSTFLPELEKAILENVEGEGTRGKLIGAIKETLGAGFNPNTVQEILSKSIGDDNAKKIFSSLSPGLSKFGEEVKLGAAALDQASKDITEAGKRALREGTKFLGDPTQDQSKAISEIIAGKAAFNRGIPSREDLIRRKKDPFDLSEAASAKSRQDLERLKLEGQTGIFSGDQGQRNGRARGALSQLFNATRVQVDKGFVNQEIEKFASKNPGFGFGEGKLKGFTATANKAIESGDFSTLRKDSTFNSLKTEGINGSSSAAELIKVFSDAEQRFNEQNSAVQTAVDKFLNQNELQTQISANTKATADGIATLVAQSKSAFLPVGASGATRDVRKIMQNNGRIQELTSSLLNKQRAFDDVSKTPGIDARAEFSSNLTSFLGNKISGISNAALSRGGLDKNDPAAIRGQSLTPSEIEKVSAIAARVTSEKLGNRAFTDLSNEAFGKERASEIIRGGIFDPLKNSNNSKSFNPAASSNLQNEIQTINKTINDLKLQNSVLQNPQSAESAKVFENGVNLFTQAIDAFTQGANIAFNAQIGVDVTGGPDKSFQENLKAGIRALFTELYAEATGKKPVLAPVAP